MKLVVAIVKPFKIDDIREAMLGIGVEGLTITEAKGIGRQKGHTEIYRGAECEMQFLPKLKVEVAVADDRAEAVVNTLQQTASTGRIGDGKIFVFDVSEAVRIRTGETGMAAL